jgi:hypothetical protein
MKELKRAHDQSSSPMAMTNEERFIASCESVGEADVRQKLNASRYGGSKAVWANDWLERVESTKSDATRAEEKSSRLHVAAGTNRHFRFGFSTLLLVLLVLLLASAALFFMFR